MNQMLGTFGKENNEISQKRINEIFSIPKTEKIWKEIELNETFQKIFGKIAVDRFLRYSGKSSKLEDYKERIKENEKRQIIFSAMYICAQEGCSFNAAVQKSAEIYLRELKKMSSSELNEIIEEKNEIARANAGYEKLIKAIFPVEYEE